MQKLLTMNFYMDIVALIKNKNQIKTNSYKVHMQLNRD